jgi:aminoglycoside phosphotransferase (APT) family kinase protein
MTMAGSTKAVRRIADADRWPRPDEVIARLIRVGAVDPARALTEGLACIPCGRSHAVLRVELGGQPVLSVKLFGAPRGETEGTAAAELLVRDLARKVPALAALVPDGHDSGDPHLLIAQWVAGKPAWEAEQEAAPDLATGLPMLSARLVPLLATMHRATARYLRDQANAIDRRVPWILRLVDGDSPTELWSNPVIADVMAQILARPELVAGLRRARAAWRPVGLIHGDCKLDNVIIGDDDAIRLIDWEMARLGDPAWDLAALSHRLLIDQGEGAAAHLTQLAKDYARAVAVPAQPIALRVPLYGAAWTLMSVLQFRSTAAELEAETIARMLDAAAAGFAMPPTVADG